MDEVTSLAKQIIKRLRSKGIKDQEIYRAFVDTLIYDDDKSVCDDDAVERRVDETGFDDFIGRYKE